MWVLKSLALALLGLPVTLLWLGVFTAAMSDPKK